MGDLVAYQLEDSLATVTMDDGKVNVLSMRMLHELNAALDAALADKAVVVVTGREGVFSAGFDLGVLTAGGVDAHGMLIAGFELAERILSFPQPVVMACNGHALAMASFLLLSGDYRIGVAGDYTIRANEVAIGLTMPWFGIEISRQRLAPAHFYRAVINAEKYSPEGAVLAGFLDQVVAPAELDAAARSAAADLGGLNLEAHAATKLRARRAALKAIRAAIEIDDAELRSFL
jgi:enoyl-CoA hydratase